MRLERVVELVTVSLSWHYGGRESGLSLPRALTRSCIVFVVVCRRKAFRWTVVAGMPQAPDWVINLKFYLNATRIENKIVGEYDSVPGRCKLFAGAVPLASGFSAFAIWQARN